MDPSFEEAVRNVTLTEIQPSPRPKLPDGPISAEERQDFDRRDAEWLLNRAIHGDGERPYLQLGPPFQPVFDPSALLFKTDAEGKLVFPETEEGIEEWEPIAPREYPMGLSPLVRLSAYDQARLCENLRRRRERLSKLESESENQEEEENHEEVE